MTLMETAQLLGNFGEFVGAIAVVVTLIYFGLQLRQASANVKAASHQSASQGRTALRMALSGDQRLTNIVRRGLAEPDVLDQDEYMQFNVFLVEEFRIIQSAYFLNKGGLADPEFWIHERFVVGTYKLAPAFDIWWQDAKSYYAEEFAGFVQEEPPQYAFGHKQIFGIEPPEG